MDTSNVSVQSFYGKDVQTAPPVARISEPFKAGDGFTEDELASAMDPLRRAWDPEREYEQLGIAQLVPGPRAVTFVGRVVNLATRYGRSAKQPKARGWHFLLVKDDQAAISVSSREVTADILSSIGTDYDVHFCSGQVILCPETIPHQARSTSHILDRIYS